MREMLSKAGPSETLGVFKRCKFTQEIITFRKNYHKIIKWLLNTHIDLVSFDCLGPRTLYHLNFWVGLEVHLGFSERCYKKHQKNFSANLCSTGKMRRRNRGREMEMCQEDPTFCAAVFTTCGVEDHIIPC